MRALFFALLLMMTSHLTAFDSTIPVLHLPDFYAEETREAFLEQLEEAASEVGFFALTGTGVDVELLDEAYDTIREYFALDFESKMELLTKDGERGYVPGESAKGDERVDCKEFFHIGRELSDEDLERLKYIKNVWPDEPGRFRRVMQSLYETLDSCKEAIAEAFGSVVGRGPDYIKEMVKEGACLMRALHYPANPPEGSIWASEHTDINFFTILPRSTAEGLQVFNQEGEWIDVVVPDGAFIINCGDMMQNVTNGYFRSSVHRVIDTGTGVERFSVVFFVHPRSDDRLDPLPEMIEKTGGVRRYANLCRRELFAERIIDLGLASEEMMQFFVESGAIEKLEEVGRFSEKAKSTLLKAGFEL